MAILSKRIISQVSRTYYQKYGARPCFVDLAGKIMGAKDELAMLTNMRRKRNYALQESINLGEAYVFFPVPIVGACMVGLENERMVHGGLIGGEVVIADKSDAFYDDSIAYMISHGISRTRAVNILKRLPKWPEQRMREASKFLEKTFYQISGWTPDLMKENRLKIMQAAQINQAIRAQRGKNEQALYAFEKERALLANIRAGDRKGARRILNEMLATIYMSSPKLAVLRARVVELMSCLTRAAIEDNPLMEPLIERNHAWTEKLVAAKDFETLSQVLMAALDDFIEGIYLHGFNRSNAKVRKALEFISENFMKTITLNIVADHVGLSSSRLAHVVKQFTGRTITQIIHEVRVRNAQRLLVQTSKSCTEIAYDVGFGDQSYFIKHFKRISGSTPARYRRHAV